MNLTKNLLLWWEKNKFRIDDSEKVVVTLVNGREEPDIERLEPTSEEMELRIPADVNDIHIPRYFENGKRTKLVRVGYMRRKTYLFGRQYTNEIIMNELEKIRGQDYEIKQ